MAAGVKNAEAKRKPRGETKITISNRVCMLGRDLRSPTLPPSIFWIGTEPRFCGGVYLLLWPAVPSVTQDGLCAVDLDTAELLIGFCNGFRIAMISANEGLNFGSLQC